MNAVDLRSALQSWPFDGESAARLTHGLDGREIILVRQPLGLEQYELHGRPDGLRPHEMDSALAFHLSRREAARATAAAFELSAESCAELFQEGTQYYHRFAHLFRIEDWARAERDAEHNLTLIDFVKCHAGDDDNRRRAEQWRPDISRMHAVAAAMHRMEKPQDDDARHQTGEGHAVDRLERHVHLHEEPSSPSRSARCPEESAFLRQGDYWTIIYQQHLAHLKTTRGLHCLAELLRHPNCEFHVAQLMARIVNQPLLATKWQAGWLADAGPMLDQQAKSECKRRLAELREELEEAERFNDSFQATRARDEMNAISRHLASAVGLGGRDRKTGYEAERARSAVTKRIKSAIHKIAEVIPPLGHHLAARIKTGYFCSYNPHPDRPVAWRFQQGGEARNVTM